MLAAYRESRANPNGAVQAKVKKRRSAPVVEIPHHGEDDGGDENLVGVDDPVDGDHSRFDPVVGALGHYFGGNY